MGRVRLLIGAFAALAATGCIYDSQRPGVGDGGRDRPSAENLLVDVTSPDRPWDQATKDTPSVKDRSLAEKKAALDKAWSDTKLAPDKKLPPDTKLAPDTKLPLDGKRGPETKVPDTRPAPDQPLPPPLLVNWKLNSACGSAPLLLGGGASCGTDTITGLWPSSNQFTVNCSNGTGTLWSACKGTLVGALWSNSQSASSGSATVTCTSTYPKVVGGGCVCAGGGVRASYPTNGTLGGWTCNCLTGTAMAYVVCTDSAAVTVQNCASQNTCSCSGGETIIGGGCQCNSSGTLSASRPSALVGGVAAEWQCSCDTGIVDDTYVLCAQ